MAFMADALSEITQNSDEYEGLSSIFKSKIFQSNQIQLTLVILL